MEDFTLRKGMNRAISLIETRGQLSMIHSLPQCVDIVLTKACNLACTFCKTYELPGEAKKISVENFEKIARQLFATARQVSFCSGGEPYLHMNLEDLLRICRRYKVATWVLSNGMLLKEERIRTIVREELVSRHGFSVDGINASTVEAIRVNARLDLILENIKMLIRIRKEEGKQKPTIVIRYALMRSNVGGITRCCAILGRDGYQLYRL